MALSRGQLASKADITNWYQIFNTFIGNYASSVISYLPELDESITAKSINNLMDKTREFVNDQYLKTEPGFWWVNGGVTKGEKITIDDTISRISSTVSNFEKVKCRNQVTNSYGSNSCGAHQNGTAQIPRNDTCLNCSERNSCLTHGTCSNGTHRNCSVTGKQSGTNSSGSNSNVKKSSGTNANATKYCGSKSSGACTSGTKSNGYHSSGTKSCGSKINGNDYCNSGTLSCGRNGNGAWNQTTKNSGTNTNICGSGTNSCGMHANTWKSNTKTIKITCLCSTFVNN